MRQLQFVVGLFAWLAVAGATEALPVDEDQAPAPPSNAAVPAPPELRAIRTELLDRIRRGDVPSFALGVARGHEVVWEEALGWADRESKMPATTETLYPVASVSKSITATGALALVAEGKLRLDRPVEDVLDHELLQASLDGVLVSHLLAHTSSIPHLWHYEYPDRRETIVRRQELIRDNAFLALPPGEKFLYSNLGYGVLAEVVERVAGAPFQQVLERILFEPLEMRRTTVDAWVGEGGVVRGYDGDGEAIPYSFRLAPDGGAGFFSNARDLLRYALFHLGAQERTLPAKDASITASLGELSPEEHYLRGWGVVRLAKATVLISDGEAAGGTAVVVLVPEKELAVVALCNVTGGPAVETAVAILSALNPGFDEQFASAVTLIRRELSAPEEVPTGQFKGILFDDADELEVSVDFSDSRRPFLQLGEFTYLLQEVSWNRGALQATVVGSLPIGVGKGRTHHMILTLWKRGDEIRGIAQEDLMTDRPCYGIPHLLVLRSVQTGR